MLIFDIVVERAKEMKNDLVDAVGNTEHVACSL